MEIYNKAEILQMIEEEDVEFIRLQFTDMFGVMKNIAVPSNQICKILENCCTINLASLDGFEEEEDIDMYLKPDFRTFAILPWRPQQGKVARFLCDICDENGEEYELSPRTLLKKVLLDADKKGYRFQVNPECEFFLFHTDDNGQPTTITHEKGVYLDTAPIDLGENARRDMILTLTDMGYEIESSHHEMSPAQHEIDFTFDNALETADKVMTFKNAVRIIAKRYGLHATFMPKPITDVNGSGMHLNMRLFQNGKNILEDEEGKLSDAGRAFISGILSHIQGMTAIFNPLVNSYKRLVPYFNKSTVDGLSAKKKGTLIRIRKRKGESLSLELCSPDSVSNPYLVYALCFAAGLDGLEHHMEATDSRMLPENLKEALNAMSQDEMIQEILGKDFVSRYVKIKQEEWEEYAGQVSEWELKRYLYS